MAAYGLSPRSRALVPAQVGSQSLRTSGRWRAYRSTTNTPATSPAASEARILHALEGEAVSGSRLGLVLMGRVTSGHRVGGKLEAAGTERSHAPCGYLHG